MYSERGRYVINILYISREISIEQPSVGLALLAQQVYSNIQWGELANFYQSKSQQSKIVHFIPKTGCRGAAAFHLLIFYHKLPHISIAYI